MYPSAPNTAFGVPLAADERVVFVHQPLPVGAGERVFLVFLGIIMLPVFLTGILIIVHAIKKQSDRAWFVTNRRFINVKSSGAVLHVALEDVVAVHKYKASSTMELRGGKHNVTLPLVAKAGEVTMHDLARTPRIAMNMPSVAAPP